MRSCVSCTAYIEECGRGGGHVVGTHEVTSLKTRCRWEDNIKTSFKEIEWESMDWINLAQDRDKRQTVVNMTLILWVV
jgi:hypothetical protein